MKRTSRKTVRQGGSPSGSLTGSARGGGGGGFSSTTRHGSVVYRHTGGVNAPMGERLEAFGMQRAEEEQCGNSDKFWGIDKESEDCARDRVLMQREFELSSTHEQHCKVIQLQQVRVIRPHQPALDSCALTLTICTFSLCLCLYSPPHTHTHYAGVGEAVPASATRRRICAGAARDADAQGLYARALCLGLLRGGDALRVERRTASAAADRL